MIFLAIFVAFMVAIAFSSAWVAVWTFFNPKEEDKRPLSAVYRSLRADGKALASERQKRAVLNKKSKLKRLSNCK